MKTDNISKVESLELGESGWEGERPVEGFHLPGCLGRDMQQDARQLRAWPGGMWYQRMDHWAFWRFHGRFLLCLVCTPCVLVFGRVIHRRFGGARGWWATAQASTFLPPVPSWGGDRVPRPPHPVVSLYRTTEASSQLGAKTEHTLTGVIVAKPLTLSPPPGLAHTGSF